MTSPNGGEGGRERGAVASRHTAGVLALQAREVAEAPDGADRLGLTSRR